MIHVLHHNDPDGYCAAAVVYRWWEETEPDHPVSFHEVNYDRPFPLDLNEVDKEDIIVIVDFSLKPDIMWRVCEASDNVVWCDHHVTAKEYGYNVPGVRDFSNKGLSGCECTWQHFFPNRYTPDAVTLVGDYDSWRHKRAPESIRFHAGLKLRDIADPTSHLWEALLFGDVYADAVIEEVCSDGRTAMRTQDQYATALRQSFGHEVIFEGLTCYALNTARMGSQAFGPLMDSYPICIMFITDGTQWTVSLYSEKDDIHCGELARKHGGGGHKGAAGFICDTLPFRKE